MEAGNKAGSRRGSRWRTQAKRGVGVDHAFAQRHIMSSRFGITSVFGLTRDHYTFPEALSYTRFAYHNKMSLLQINVPPQHVLGPHTRSASSRQ